MTEHNKPEDHTLHEKRTSLVLGGILLAGVLGGAWYFLTNKPTLPLATPEEVAAADRWLKVLYAVMTLGFAVSVVAGIIGLSTAIKRARAARAKSG